MNTITAVEMANRASPRDDRRPGQSPEIPEAEPNPWQDRLAKLTIVGFVLALAYLFWFA